MVLQKEYYGGILCDIGSHQVEQYLSFAGETDATVTKSLIANYNNPEHPELDDFGEAVLIGKKGTNCYFRVDWFTPDGLNSWGDGRTIILGTKGYIEIRKYIDVGRDLRGNNVYVVDDKKEQYINVDGIVGYPFFGKLILDCLNRTEFAMTQYHAFKAAELCLIAQRVGCKDKLIISMRGYRRTDLFRNIPCIVIILLLNCNFCILFLFF